MNTSLTDQNYWEKYYKESNADRDKVIRVCSFYDDFWEKLINSSLLPDKPKSLIEIGGYPGRYLAYLGKKYDLVPTSLDFNSDRTRIDEMMELFDVEDYEIIQADFLKHKPEKQYDLVLSNGFIEHFENYDELLDKHVEYLKPGGTMLIMIPNKRGYTRSYRYLVDRANLRAHNLKCMKLSVFRNFAKRNKLETLDLTYYGGFPYSPHQSLNFPQKVWYKIHKVISRKFFDEYLLKNPSKYFSSLIIGIYRKPLDS